DADTRWHSSADYALLMNEVMDSSVTTDLLSDQRQRWEAGKRARVEDFLLERPELRDDNQQLLDLIYHEIYLREEHGEKPTADEYIVRFPEFAGDLRRQFEVHAAFADDAPSPTIRRESGDSAIEEALRPILHSGDVVPGYEMVAEVGRGGM